VKLDAENDEVHDDLVELHEIGNALGWSDERIAKAVYEYLVAAFPKWNATRH
jgi:hypothetical protein